MEDSRKPMASVGVVAIGRNEGERLRRCIDSVVLYTHLVVYVDSGSTDGSVAMARGKGVEVVELDMSIPFTAARARNEGFLRLRELAPDVSYVQFVDGDCEVVKGWMEAAISFLDRNEDVAVVCGWRSERHRGASVYNMMCDIEWHQPAGEIEACGGDCTVRAEVVLQLAGFNPRVIAAEDDEFCVRIRKAGWKILRLPTDMTVHDANMFTFSAWWRRAMRAGHGFAQVGDMHPGYFLAPRRRTLFWGLALPLLILLGLPLTGGSSLGLGLLYPISFAKSYQGLRTSGVAARDAWRYAGFLMISKFPGILGMLLYWRRRLSHKNFEIIEYK